MAMAQTILKHIGQDFSNLILPKVKIEEYCRLCLSSDDTEFKQLFSPFNTIPSIAEVIEDFAKISIQPQDEYSKLICCSCFIRLTESQNFKYLIENSDFKLRNQLIGCKNLLGSETVGHSDGADEKIDVEETDLNQVLLEDNEQNNTIILNYGLIKSEEDSAEVIEKDVDKTELNQTQISEIDDKTSKDAKVKKKYIKRKIKKEKGSLEDKKIKKVYQVKCPQCDEVFKDHRQRAEHLISHTGKYPLYCSFCNKGFTRRHALNVHEKCHTGEKNYRCEICNKSFNQSSNLITHKKTHTDEKQFKCDQCPKEYTRKRALQVHIASIHYSNADEPNFVCIICNKAYRTEHQLREHTGAIHKQEPMTCYICGESIISYSQHMKKHTKPYKCNVCNRAFSREWLLKEHSTIHTGDKLYECDICQKTFRFRSVLYAHKKIHDKTKRIQCELCDKQFTHKHHWKAHLERVHQMIDD